MRKGGLAQMELLEIHCLRSNLVKSAIYSKLIEPLSTEDGYCLIGDHVDTFSETEPKKSWQP